MVVVAAAPAPLEAWLWRSGRALMTRRLRKQAAGAPRCSAPALPRAPRAHVSRWYILDVHGVWVGTSRPGLREPVVACGLLDRLRTQRCVDVFRSCAHGSATLGTLLPVHLRWLWRWHRRCQVLTGPRRGLAPLPTRWYPEQGSSPLIDTRPRPRHCGQMALLTAQVGEQLCSVLWRRTTTCCW